MMHLSVLAVGHARGTHEDALCNDYIDRANGFARRLGISKISVEEIGVSRARDARSRIQEECEKLSKRVPTGAHVILLDAKGKGMTSEDFAEMIAALRDAGTKDLALVIGGPDGLASLPGIRAGRSLAFGPQTWPHLMVRTMLAEQIYRALTILAGHPYHRG